MNDERLKLNAQSGLYDISLFGDSLRLCDCLYFAYPDCIAILLRLLT